MIAHSNVSLFLRDVTAEENTPVAQGYSLKVESLQLTCVRLAPSRAADSYVIKSNIYAVKQPKTLNRFHSSPHWVPSAKTVQSKSNFSKLNIISSRLISTSSPNYRVLHPVARNINCK
jgi:hypothetical protein